MLARGHVRRYVDARRLQAFQPRFETAFQFVQPAIEHAADRIQLAAQFALVLHHRLFELAGHDGLALPVVPKVRVQLLAQIGEARGLGFFGQIALGLQGLGWRLVSRMWRDSCIALPMRKNSSVTPKTASMIRPSGASSTTTPKFSGDVLVNSGQFWAAKPATSKIATTRKNNRARIGVSLEGI